MATLWNKGSSATEKVENFTVGEDCVLDMKLAKYDVLGSKAHIAMLESIGLLEKEELSKLNIGLDKILNQIEKGEFRIEEGVEDIHSQVELQLTKELGEIGKKIHSGRSRNDQVLVDIKLFLRDEVQSIKNQVLNLFNILQSLSEKYKDILLPGYTHNQIAMPSSFGLWFGAYAECLVDDMYLLAAVYRIINRNPLGSAAGYGSSFPLNRELTTELLAFDSPNYNSISAQMSRGRCEKALASALASISLTLNKFASDCCLFMSPNYGFIRFPDSLTTGSSIMPHKKNPDVWEIMRAKCNRVIASENEIAMMCSNLAHGYHRDYQILKNIIWASLEHTHSCLEMASYMLESIEVNDKILSNPIYKYMFTVEEVNRRVLSGESFRDAYKEVGIEVNKGIFEFKDIASLKVSDLGHSHIGSIGNLCNDKIAELMSEAQNW